MYFADEVRNPRKELDNLPARSAARGKDLDMAVNLIEAMTSEWDPKNYRDTYTERVKKLVEARKNDREIVTDTESEPTSEKVTDLLAALQASVEQSKGHRPGNAHDLAKLRTRKAEERDEEPAKKSTAKKSTAKKSTPKKSTAKKSTAKKSTAKKSTAKKSTAKRSTAKKAS
jgi:DNA end-binding protein Ku